LRIEEGKGRNGRTECVKKGIKLSHDGKHDVKRVLVPEKK